MKISTYWRRKAVQMFLDGERPYDVARHIFGADAFADTYEVEEVEQIIRDYINGKFTLEPKGKRKP